MRPSSCWADAGVTTSDRPNKLSQNRTSRPNARCADTQHHPLQTLDNAAPACPCRTILFQYYSGKQLAQHHYPLNVRTGTRNRIAGVITGVLKSSPMGDQLARPTARPFAIQAIHAAGFGLFVTSLKRLTLFAVRSTLESGQRKTRQSSPLTGTSRLMHCNMIDTKRKTASRRSLQSSNDRWSVELVVDTDTNNVVGDAGVVSRGPDNIRDKATA